MRDLYRRLEVDKDAPFVALSSAMQRCANQGLRADATAILTVSERREAYDDIHELLNALGSLRIGLGLTHAPHWQGELASDFTQPPPAISRQQQLLHKLEAVLTQRQQRWRFRLGLMAGLTVLSGLLVAAFVLGRWSV
ncbi:MULTISPECIES: hypothetical protein [Salinicola]|uniref:Type IV / VI secretion system DotU domain-containing protein n=1 Tax=Salinicola socius TaxID=404433 RepID=A0A1Q8SMW3_9GAMM|nr:MULTISPECIES: hypothetical protein [Salinicola]OLO02767.1 hypothetical protein BTW07_17830 [Salinicola socius]